MTRTAWISPALTAAFVVAVVPAAAAETERAPQNDTQLKHRVAALVRELADNSRGIRNEARRNLVELGPAVLPLLRKDGHPEKARAIYEDLRRRMSAEYDEGGHIGKRYRRQDEIGTPFAVTIDHQTLEDDTVTLRDRDSLAQERVAVAGLADELARRVGYSADAAV